MLTYVQVAHELSHQNNNISENLRWITHGPRFKVIKYQGYSVNKCRYHVKGKDDQRVHQNSGVRIIANTMQIASSKDKNPTVSNMSFYGVIQELWDLNYNKFKISIFKCDLVDSGNGTKVDELGFLVDLNKIGHKSDQFILASQAKQIFYIQDPVDER